MALGAVVAVTAVLLVFQLGQARIFMVMARDGLLPAGVLPGPPPLPHARHGDHPRGDLRRPGPLASSRPSQALELTSIGTLFAFVIVSAGVIALRIQDPHRPRPFRCPGYPVTPLLSIAFCIWLMAGLPPMNWLRFGAWLAVGAVIYFAYGRRKSRLRRHRGRVSAGPFLWHHCRIACGITSLAPPSCSPAWPAGCVVGFWDGLHAAVRAGVGGRGRAGAASGWWRPSTCWWAALLAGHLRGGEPRPRAGVAGSACRPPGRLRRLGRLAGWRRRRPPPATVAATGLRNNRFLAAGIVARWSRWRWRGLGTLISPALARLLGRAPRAAPTGGAPPGPGTRSWPPPPPASC